MGEEPDRPGAEVSERWMRWRRAIDLEDYDARWERMLASGDAAHGEADFVTTLGPTAVLDAGCGTGRVAIELARRGIEAVGVDLDRDMVDHARRKAPGLVWVHGDLATVQLGRTFPVVLMAGNVLLFARPQDRGAIVANLAGLVAPGGVMVAGFSLEQGGYTLEEYDDHCAVAGLEVVERWCTWDRDPYGPGSDYHVSMSRHRCPT